MIGTEIDELPKFEKLELADYPFGAHISVRLTEGRAFLAILAEPDNGVALVYPNHKEREGSFNEETVATLGSKPFIEGSFPRILPIEGDEGPVEDGMIRAGDELVLSHEDGMKNAVSYTGRPITGAYYLGEQAKISLEDRQKIDIFRRSRIAPLLADLVIQGQAAYHALRPRAEHVSTVPRDFPLRHQQIHGMGAGGPAGVCADYLMVALGDNHDLILYQNFGPGRNFTWQFERSVMVGDKLSQQTKVEVVPNERPLHPGSGLKIAVSNFSYPDAIGVNSRFAGDVCGYMNGYKDASAYIEAMSADLAEAQSRFGS